MSNATAKHIEWLFRTAIQYHRQGQLDKARMAFERIIELDPSNGRAAHSLGFIAMQREDNASAVPLLERAARLGHDTSQVQNNWGVALVSLGRRAESIPHFRLAVTLDPKFAQAWGNLGEALILEGDPWEADEPLRRAALNNASDPIQRRQARIFRQNFFPDVSLEAQTRAAVEFGRLVETGNRRPSRYRNIPDPLRQLKVGLVSGDFHNHAVPRFLMSFLMHVDPDRIEFHAYANGHQSDGVTEKLRSLIPVWRDIHLVKDNQASMTIAEDGIDVLFDLSGHTGSNRLPLFACKPAPIEVTWLGYSGTTGLSSIDYILADSIVLPPDEELLFTEKAWRLPDAYLCFTPPAMLPDVALLPATATGQLTFGSFNNLSKINGDVATLWSEILSAVPRSRLLLKNSAATSLSNIERVKRLFAAGGVGAERLIVLERDPDDRSHLGTYGRVDIGLDTFPYNGTTTTCEALVMGVPVVTLKGDHFVAHVGESILRTAGLPHLVAADRAAYVEIAKALASDLETLAADRATLRDRFLASPMADAPRFARNFEDAVRGMWRIWCAAQGRG